MKSKNPVIWDRTPDLENLVEQALKESERLDERDVAVQFGVAGQPADEYIIPEEEVAEINALLDVSTDPASPEGSRSRRIDDNTFSTVVRSVAERYAPTIENAYDTLLSIVEQYRGSGNVGAKAVKILFSQPDNVNFPLFSHTGNSIPDSGGLGRKLLELDYAKKAGAVGKGELLALLLYGGTPSRAGQEVDIQLTRPENLAGGWHVKYMESFSNLRLVPWGEASKPLFITALRNQLGSISGLSSTVQTKIIDLMDSKTGFKPADAEEKLTSAGVNDTQMQSVADALDAAVNTLAQSNGEARGVLFAKPGEFQFRVANASNPVIKFAMLANKTGRINIGGPNHPGFWQTMTRARDKRNTLSSASGEWDNLLRQSEYQGAAIQTANGAVNLNTKGLALVNYFKTLPVNDRPYPGIDKLKTILASKGLSRRQVHEWIYGADQGNKKWNTTSSYEDIVKALLRPEGDWAVNESKKNLRLRLLVEELTRSDKKDIEKMIRKRIEADRAEQKRQFKKHLAEEMKKSKFQQTILEMAKEEMGKELKGKQLESVVVDVTKKVIKKLYREMSHAYNPVIDRIKL